MAFKNYYAFDVIENREGEFRIIDAHGLTDSIGFTERAGYKPRFDRVYKYMNILKEMRKGGEKILFTFTEKSGNSEMFRLPKSLEKYYNGLPKGVAHLNWVKDSLKRDEKERRKHARYMRKGRKNAFMKDLEYLKKAARHSEVEFDCGVFKAYAEDRVLYAHVDFSELGKAGLRAENKAPKFDEIGLIVNWGDETSVHPSSKNFWYGEKSEVPFNFINDLKVTELFTLAGPKTVFPLYVAANCSDYYDKLLPKETYLGMGMSTYETLKNFREELEEKGNGKVAVRKPLCTHRGCDVSFLSGRKLNEIVRKERKIDDEIPKLRRKFRRKLKAGFKFTYQDEENHAFIPALNYKGNRNKIYPFVEMGAYTLQEYVDPKPVLSKKTGHLHQGPIRVQLLNGELISAMHRLPKKPYRRGEFVDLTAKNVPTFFERTDDETEKILGSEFKPFLSCLEESMKESKTSPAVFNYMAVDCILKGMLD